jgi:hypothetical protein
MFKSHGYLHYDSSDGFRLALKVDQDLSDYYRTLVPKHYRVYRQGWSAHLTVVRPGNDNPGKIRFWEDYENEKVEFIYSPYLECGKGFYWFNAWSKRLEHIREELGLVNTSKFALKPEGYNKTFHCTIGKYDEVFSSGEAPEK